MSRAKRKKEVETGTIKGLPPAEPVEKQAVVQAADSVVEAAESSAAKEPVIEAEPLETPTPANAEPSRVEEFFEGHKHMSLDEVQYALHLLGDNTHKFMGKTTEHLREHEEALQGYNTLMANQTEILKQQQELLGQQSKRLDEHDATLVKQSGRLFNHEQRISTLEKELLGETPRQMPGDVYAASAKVEPEAKPEAEPEALPALTSVPAPDVPVEVPEPEPVQPPADLKVEDLFGTVPDGRQVRPGYFSRALDGSNLKGPFPKTSMAKQGSPVDDYNVIWCWVEPNGSLGKPLTDKEVDIFLPQVGC